MLENILKIKLVDGLLAGGMLLVAVGIGISIKESNATNKKVEIIQKPTVTEVIKEVQVDSKVVIDIAGEVLNPGIYKLKKGDRIEDVLLVAGGLTTNADRDWVDININRAELIVDGQKIYIPNNQESKKLKVESKTTNNLISLNKANLEELDRLDGVGPSIAQRIIDYRENNGGFKTTDEIKLVPGIGDKMYEKIKDRISL